MTQLRKKMLEETPASPILRVRYELMSASCANWLHTSISHPTGLAPTTCGSFQAHMFRERKLNARTVVQYSNPPTSDRSGGNLGAVQATCAAAVQRVVCVILGGAAAQS